MKTISSIATLYLKIFSLLFIVFVIFTVPSLAIKFLQSDKPATTDFLFPLFLFPVFAAIQGFISYGLKRVRLDDDNLYISNYFEEISVPVTEIERVAERRFFNHRRVTIYFKTDTKFGRSIYFAPKTNFSLLYWEQHPIVGELKEASQHRDFMKRLS